MAASSETWMREFQEASKLVEEVNNMLSGKGSNPPSGPETQRHMSAARRKLTILRTRLETLDRFLSKLSGNRQITPKETNRRQDMLSSLGDRANQLANALNMSVSTDRDSLLGPEKNKDQVMKRAEGLENRDLVGFQRQVMKEQDDGLEKLEETVTSTKHIALAVNEELSLQTRLLEDIDDHVDTTDSRLARVQKRLAVLNKRTKGGCSSLILLVVVIVALIVAICALIKYL